MTMRKFLGRNTTLMTRETIFETDDAVEVESHEGYEVSRKRVLFDEVLLVTFHRERRPLFIALNLIGAVFFSAFGVVVAINSKADMLPFVITFGIIAAPFLLAAVYRALFPLDCVSIFGRRSKAAIRFGLRKRRARELYGYLCSRTAAAQRGRGGSVPEHGEV